MASAPQARHTLAQPGKGWVVAPRYASAVGATQLRMPRKVHVGNPSPRLSARVSLIATMKIVRLLDEG